MTKSVPVPNVPPARLVDMSDFVTLRSATDDDLAGVTAVFAAQDIAWWDEVDGDVDDVRGEFDRTVAAFGTLADGARVALVDGAVVGVALHVGHGQTNVAVDPSTGYAERSLEMLIDWLIESGATLIDAPAHDAERLDVLRARRWTPVRSSFDLERVATVDDLVSLAWPTDISASPFRRGVDDQAVHDMIYSVWTDVAGHTHRPIEEWRALFLDVPSYDPDLVVLARHRDGHVAGIAMCRVFDGELGWVNQLAVGRPDRGVGLGRALLVESFRRFADRGVERLGLGVEADNGTALGLYRSVGLEVTREWMHCAPEMRD